MSRRTEQDYIPGSTYLALSAEIRQRVAEIEGLLKATSGLPLRFFTAVGILGVAIVVGAHPLGALFLGRLGLHLCLGRAGTAGHPAAR